MPEEFILLGAEEQGEVITALAARLGRSPAVLEKDAWVCWVLDALFSMPGRVQMAFKGGTSLSKGALAARDILESVVRHKSLFFYTSYADYGACLDGRCRLVPDEPAREGLETDYDAMIDAGMFDKTPPSFAEIVIRLKQLEVQLGQTTGFYARH